MSNHNIIFSCPDCDGTGVIFNPLTGGYNFCERCNGKGAFMVPKEVETTSDQFQRLYSITNKI